MKPHDYIIAGTGIRLAARHFAFGGLAPFRAELAALPDLEMVPGRIPDVPAADRQPIDTFDFADADAVCLLERYARPDGSPAGYLFTLSPRDGSRPVGFAAEAGSAVCRTDFSPGDLPMLFRFGLWMMLNIRTAQRSVAAIHSSVILHRGEAVLFLGESGTGKSTHTRLWREHIPGAELLNDDSPFIRTDADGTPLACGSPWSGKTPCYRPVEVPIRGIVRLSQGPENRIERLSVLRAYGALQPSFPPSLAHDESLADGINDLISKLLSRIPVYRLSCLPDAEAAQLACRTLYDDAPCR